MHKIFRWTERRQRTRTKQIKTTDNSKQCLNDVWTNFSNANKSHMLSVRWANSSIVRFCKLYVYVFTYFFINPRELVFHLPVICIRSLSIRCWRAFISLSSPLPVKMWTLQHYKWNRNHEFRKTWDLRKLAGFAKEVSSPKEHAKSAEKAMIITVLYQNEQDNVCKICKTSLMTNEPTFQRNQRLLRVSREFSQRTGCSLAFVENFYAWHDFFWHTGQPRPPHSSDRVDRMRVPYFFGKGVVFANLSLARELQIIRFWPSDFQKRRCIFHLTPKTLKKG